MKEEGIKQEKVQQTKAGWRLVWKPKRGGSTEKKRV